MWEKQQLTLSPALTPTCNHKLGLSICSKVQALSYGRWCRQLSLLQDEGR